MTAHAQVRLADRTVRFPSLTDFADRAGFDLARVPYVGRVLAESLLRAGEPDSARTLGTRLADGAAPDTEMVFRPARVIVQDYTGIPLLTDLAALRDEAADPGRVNPALPVDIVVDHSVQTQWAGRPDALARNQELELRRNRERYAFLKWAQTAFDGLRVIPPGRGIVHQVNLEQLATVVADDGHGLVFPDTVIGTDSHTTMVNGLGVLGWGVGGLEAEALLLGMAPPVRVPPVTGVRLTGAVRPGVFATDIVLTLTHLLREANVTGLLLEFTGPGLATLPAADRCTIANMAPEYGAMAAFFPVDDRTLEYLRLTGRTESHVALVEAYCRRQRLFRDGPDPVFGRVIDFDLGSVRAALAGPSRPDQHIGLADLPTSFAALHSVRGTGSTDTGSSDTGNSVTGNSVTGSSITGGGGSDTAPGALRDGDIVIASITSCTSTSNPRAMLAAGLLARRAVERGLTVPPHVKTSLSPGSRAVARYLRETGLLADLEQLGFHVAGFGCMTCNGGSGPLNDGVGEAVTRDGLDVCAVLSGNRNFAGRIHSQVHAGYLGSPALVVALAIAGHVRLDLEREPLGTGSDGRPVHLSDLWPDSAALAALEAECLHPETFTAPVGSDPGWDDIPAPTGLRFAWDENSTYIRRPAYVAAAAPRPWSLSGARVLLALGDHISTDHISPVGQISAGSPAGRHLAERGVTDFNSYGSRRGNHEVMARGTFANNRLANRLLGPGETGGSTVHLPSGTRLPVFEAAERYAAEGVPLVILAGRNYGIGSSRDWAAKGPWLLGVRAVLAESFERIHRSNLCAMGILPLLLPEGRSWASLGLTGHEELTLDAGRVAKTGEAEVSVAAAESTLSFTVHADVHSASEWDVLNAGGALAHLRHRLADTRSAEAHSAEARTAEAHSAEARTAEGARGR